MSETRTITQEERAIAFMCGEVTLNELKDLIRSEVPVERVMELSRKLEGFLESQNVTNAEALGAAAGLTMLLMLGMALPKVAETSAPKPRQES